MNLYEQLQKDLDDKNFDKFTIMRYIYIFICRNFSYDTRFYYSDDSLKKEIFDKKIDLRNVQENEIVCSTFCDLLSDALNMFGIKNTIINETYNVFSHKHVIAEIDGFKYKLDPTKQHDHTRAKINSNLLGFSSLNENEEDFNKKIDEADKKIKTIIPSVDTNIFYDNEKIEELAKLIEESAKKRNLTENELFQEKIEYIISIINTRTDLVKYDDIDFYYSYLIKKFNLKNKVKPAIFIKNGSKNIEDIINITLIEKGYDYPTFLLLSKKNNNYCMRKIYKEEIQELLNNYSINYINIQKLFVENSKHAFPKERKVK